MADSGFFKGTSADQDRRFSDKELKLLKSMKFPPEFDKKVDMRKVNLSVIRPWIAKKVVELVGFEDEVVVEYAMGLLEDESVSTPDPKRMQINLTGFLTKDTPTFMNALWNLLLEAQTDVTGVPRTFVEEKKAEMRKARDNDSRTFDERDRRARFDEIRDSDRGGRGGRGFGRGFGRGRGGFDDDRSGRGRDRDSGWGGRGGGSGVGRRRFSRSPHRRLPSPPPRRRSPLRGGRRRSPSVDSSRSPPKRRIERSLSRSPPRRSSPRSVSRSPPPLPSRRRPRSPSFSPPRDRDRRNHHRDSRSPPPRRRRLSPPPRSASASSRSTTPPPRGGRRRSYSPRRRSHSPARRRRPSVSRERSRSPDRNKRSRRSVSPNSRKQNDRMDVDKANDDGELKIKGQASIHGGELQDELVLRESELKERALRNKVMRSRKSSN